MILRVQSDIFVDTYELQQFIRDAKINTYATGGGEVPLLNIWIPGNTEHEYQSGDFYYRDSYCGFMAAPGREVVKIGGPNGLTIWSMSYDGGMVSPYLGFQDSEIKFARYVFRFLKLSLASVPYDLPLRGPSSFKHEGYPDFVYNLNVKGDLARFSGNECIFAEVKERPKTAFLQSFAGGIVIYR